MFRCIKEIFLTLLAIATLFFVVYLLFFQTCSAGASDLRDFYIPVEEYPDLGRIVFVPSYNEKTFDLERYIDLSNETGLYPSWGWTGEYYITGVTHGPVDTYGSEVTRYGSGNIYSNSSTNISGSVVPSPSALSMGLIFGGLFLIRRNRG